MTELTHCKICFKKIKFCICSEISPVDNKPFILFLQHPQEPKEDLSTARLANLVLKNSALCVGLSWPNLKTALSKSKATISEVNSSQWWVLFFGSGVKNSQKEIMAGIIPVSRSGKMLEEPRVPNPQGVIVLDGTWSQAKALWWRNPWLLKLQRVVLSPKNPSLYGKLRKEPRRETLSTIEAIAELFKDTEVETELRRVFKLLLERF